MSIDGGDPRAEAASRVHLADIDPELLPQLGDEEREEVKQVSLPTLELSERAVDLRATLHDAGAYGGVLLEGMLQQQLRIGARMSLRLLPLGEVVVAAQPPTSMVLSATEWQAAGLARFALLGREFNFAVRRWPQLHVNLQVRMAEQAERVAAQLMISQLPKVEDRVLAMLWLLAESWGRVTPAGTTLPMSPTHEALGAMIGARRSTVTLALGALSSRGALVHQDLGWLLLERSPQEGDSPGAIEAPHLTGGSPTKWTPRGESDVRRLGASLRETVARLREQQVTSTRELQERLRRTTAVRARTTEVRQRIREQRSLIRRPPPSS